MNRLALAVLLLAGCGGSDASSDSDRSPKTRPQPAAPAAIPGGGLTVASAKASTLDGPLMVSGYLGMRNGVLRLCDGLRESDPPQCMDPSLGIEGKADAGRAGERVSLLGEVDGDTLRVSETAQG